MGTVGMCTTFSRNIYTLLFYGTMGKIRSAKIYSGYFSRLFYEIIKRLAGWPKNYILFSLKCIWDGKGPGSAHKPEPGLTSSNKYFHTKDARKSVNNQIHKSFIVMIVHELVLRLALRRFSKP